MELLHAVQTALLFVIGCALIYVSLLLRNEMRSAAGALRRALNSQAETEKRLTELEARLDERPR